jgi:hypothetical protein
MNLYPWAIFLYKTIHAASIKKPPRGFKIPLEASYWHLAEDPSHTMLRKVEGDVDGFTKLSEG